MSRRKKIPLGAMFIAAMAATLLIGLHDGGRVKVLVPTCSSATNGTITVTVVLTNGTSDVLNVVDAVDGNPAMILDWGADKRWANRPRNQLKIFLNANTSITNTLALTNAPSRFRMRGVLRDLAAERRSFYVFRALFFLPKTWLEKIDERWHTSLEEKTDPLSEWIEVPK